MPRVPFMTADMIITAQMMAIIMVIATRAFCIQICVYSNHQISQKKKNSYVLLASLKLMLKFHAIGSALCCGILVSSLAAILPASPS